jgi:hypothetical protein
MSAQPQTTVAKGGKEDGSMSPLDGLRPTAQPQEEADLDRFVAAVIRSHERIQRNFRQLASGRIWPLDGEAGTEREIIEGYSALHV